MTYLPRASAAPRTAASKESRCYFSSHSLYTTVQYDDTMNPQKTLPSTTLTSGSESVGGSVPNLSTFGDNDFQGSITQRKRKERTEETDYKENFTKFRNEIMTFLKDFGKTQNENINHIREEILEIKNEMRTIKLATENFSKQFEQIQSEIESIKSNNNKTQDKIKLIENEISTIKDIQNTGEISTNKSPVLCNENLIHELKDRCDREKNIIIVGISEISDKNSKARRSYDNNEVIKLMRSLYEDCPTPIKSIRLGKYVPNRNRPMKSYFNNTDTPKILLRNKKKSPENIQIYADQTSKQIKYLQLLKEELNRRTENGEQNLIIKYTKGIPTIITNETNQKNQQTPHCKK